MKKIIGLVIIIIAIIFLWIYGRSSTPVTPAPETSTTASVAIDTNPTGEGTITTPAAPIPTATTESVKEFTILGSNYSFTPNTLEVKKGDTVRITFKNANGFHDFRIDEFNVATKQIKSGQSETVEFVADRVGTFEYYCSVGNHRAMGMKGTLTVK